ncbi:hypothetical protein HHL16_20370 [Pseudoflavitalea sp. G-6-1-2]|uniref:hypothetical protein n=1 Tax=Pseudoflavitalea sp. G-6-1-2 TaxID=2728841 RepID=UPI00146A31C2|nr:hypothetical protein [Pseudoflavitalea sp. G-6-1-2]NML23245.1 hypothetical protein [Pseudoflavitalea sp. G-6-1-2]
MPKALFIISFMLLSSLSFAQTSKIDSLSKVKKEKQILQLEEQLKEYRADSTSIETDLQQKKIDLHALQLESQSSANRNYELAAKLRKDAHDKSAARQAEKAAREAGKLAKKVRSADNAVQKYEKKLRKLTKNISSDEKKLAKLKAALQLLNNASASQTGS